jgi:hypothetical protein
VSASPELTSASQNGKLPKPAIIGICVGIAAVLVAVVLVWGICHRRKAPEGQYMLASGLDHVPYTSTSGL